MSLHNLAKHMQSQGRDGDTGLVHMSPGEIGALQKLAMANGGSLTVNPETGLPEAGFLKDFLPSIVGGLAILAAPFTGGMSLLGAAALGGGLAFGTSMAVGNSFKKSLFTGLMTGAGGAATAGLGGLGAGAANVTKAGLVPTVSGAGLKAATTPILTQAGKTLATEGVEASAASAANALRTGATNIAARAPQFAGTATQRAATAGSEGLYGTLGRIPGQQLAGNVPGQQLAGTATQRAATAGGEALYPSVAPAPTVLTGPQNYANMSMGDKLVAQGKGVEKLFTEKGAATQFVKENKGPLALAGIGAIGSNLSTPQTLRAPPPEVSTYAGPYKPVERTAQFQIGPQAYTDTSEFQYFNDVNPYPGVVPYKAAAGGLMGLAGGGSYDDEAGQDGYADGGEVGTRMATPDMDAIQNYVQSISQPRPQQAPQTQAPMAIGGEHNYGVKPVTVQQAPPVQYAPAPQRSGMEALFASLGMFGNANNRAFGKQAAPVPIVDKYTPYRPQTIYYTSPDGTKGSMEYTDLNNRIYNPNAQRMDMPFATGGMTSLARGGSYLDGPGDGLSDSIHATIGNNQPARLADGEFVISADVVSDIGGGSSKAGAKKLHAMMDRVRQSAHGTKKQVKKINDRKVLAA